MRVIPIVHCFDHNYVLPAGVAFQSLLEHAVSPETTYALHVIGSGLTSEDRDLLSGVVARFPQATLTFHEPPSLPIPDSSIPRKAHFSKDLFYKFLVSDILPGDALALLADVDVVYRRDIAEVYGLLDPSEPYYLAGVQSPAYASWRHEGLYPDERRGSKRYFTLFSPEERDGMVLTAGLLVYNCEKIRADNIVRRWVDCAVENAHRLILPEQDVFGLVCGRSGVKALPWGLMADALASTRHEKMSPEERAANPVWDEMFADPLQVHYASAVKPWKFPAMPMAELWFDACIRAGLFHVWRRWYGAFSQPMTDWFMSKKVVSLPVRVRGREITLSITKRKVK